jgi:hypothetical protein
MADCQLDYPHAPVWCPACWEEHQQTRLVAALEKANKLKERELELAMREPDGWVEPRPRLRNAQPRQTYILPEGKPQKGGMRIEPR